MVYAFALSGLLAGALLQTSARLPCLCLWPGLLGAGLLLAACCTSWLRRLVLAATLGCVLLGGWTHWHSVQRLESRLAAAMEKRTLSFDATIVEIPESLEQRTRFTVRLDQDVHGLHRGTLLLLNRFERGDHPLISLHAGDRATFSARLKRAHGLLNPGGWDREAWLWAHNIRATGTLQAVENIRRSHTAEASIATVREHMAHSIQRALHGKTSAGLITALVVGDSSGIPREQWQLYTATGLTHLISISGLHISLLAGQAAALVALIWGRIPRAPLHLPTRRVAALAGLAAALIYSILAGFSIPTQRTFFMLLFLVIQLIWRQQPLLRSLAFSLIIVLIYDPFAVLSPGLWLSFGAVAAMAAGAHGRIGKPGLFTEWGRSQAAVTIGMLPALIAMFGVFPWTSPLANLIAIPLISALVTPMALLGALLPGDGLLRTAESMATALLPVLRSMAGLGQWEQAHPPTWLWLPAILGASCAIVPRGLPGRWLGMVFMLPMLSWRIEAPAAGEWRATAFDVGQGLAVAVQTQHHTLLYDTGADWPGDGDSGSLTLLPALQALDVRHLDMLMLSHDDIDHTGGAASILTAKPPAELIGSLPSTHALWSMQRAGKSRCRSGQSWHWDGVDFEVFNPLPDLHDAEDNDSSCVLRVSSGRGALLLPGDISASRERLLHQAWGTRLRSDVVLAPHHGSKSSSSNAFLESVQAQTVVFSAGYRNRFGHPHPDVVARYARANQHQSDQTGAVHMGTGRDGVWIRTEKGSRRRFWRLTETATASPPP